MFAQGFPDRFRLPFKKALCRGGASPCQDQGGSGGAV